MNKRINIGDKVKAINDINQFSLKNYQAIDIEFFNVHLIELNDICKNKLFDKTKLYVRSSTLWELMQPEGEIGKHHFHGLSAEDIYDCIKELADPLCIYSSYNERIVIVTSKENARQEKMILVIEKHSSLENNRDANINKLITVYPKKNIENVILKLRVDQLIYSKV